MVDGREKAKRGRGKGALLLAVFGRAEGGESAWEREALPPHLGRTRAVAQRWVRRQSGRGRLRGAGGPGRTATEGGRPPRGSARAEQGRGGIQRRRQESVPEHRVESRNWFKEDSDILESRQVFGEDSKEAIEFRRLELELES
ncbi:hypothetical protein [Oryza sativa Japonica Group]|uniref:Uncharacterized protein n=1 Tax=Oryza sativa subsp. japonica TaxID=39947 RepID=Q5ZBQ0_ORYSJ|nr:hypothetical protein [Oryza sativa Japonica Group]